MSTTDLIHSHDNPRLPASDRGHDALERLRPEMAALTQQELSAMNTDVPLAVSRALGVLPAIARERARIERDCPTANLQAIDSLEDRALAADAANVDYEAAVTPPQGLQALVTEAFDARNVLNAGLGYLTLSNFIEPALVPVLKGGHGYREVADDLKVLVQTFFANWPAIDGKLAITREQLIRLRGVGEQIIRLLGEKDLAPEHATDIADTRVRAFTLLDNAYDEVRRVITYLRWAEGDADAIAPSLRTNAGPRRAADKPAPAAATATPTAQPSATPVATITPGTNPLAAPASGSAVPHNAPFGSA